MGDLLLATAPTRAALQGSVAKRLESLGGVEAFVGFARGFQTAGGGTGTTFETEHGGAFRLGCGWLREHAEREGLRRRRGASAWHPSIHVDRTSRSVNWLWCELGVGREGWAQLSLSWAVEAQERLRRVRGPDLHLTFDGNALTGGGGRGGVPWLWLRVGQPEG